MCIVYVLRIIKSTRRVLHTWRIQFVSSFIVHLFYQTHASLYSNRSDETWKMAHCWWKLSWTSNNRAVEQHWTHTIWAEITLKLTQSPFTFLTFRHATEMKWPRVFHIVTTRTSSFEFAINFLKAFEIRIVFHFQNT